MQSFIAIRDAIEAGALTPEQALKTCFDRIAEIETQLHAFTHLADQDVLLEQQKNVSGPLKGIAIGVKDIFDTFDMPTRHGSPIYKNNQPPTDSALVAMARALGGAIIGKTVTTEFAFFSPGSTVNPHDSAYSPGGSSSGSAAAVAAGMVPVALGTQTGGSIIRPAAFCGVAGYKPSFRLVPHIGVKPFSWSLDTSGFFAASMTDVAAFAAAILGRDLEIISVPPKMRIGIYRSSTFDEASTEMQNALEKAAATLSAHGAKIIDLSEATELTDARDIHAIIQNYEGARAMADEYARHKDQLSPTLIQALEHGRAISPQVYDDARRTARIARRTSAKLFDEVDILLAPSAPGIAPLGHDTTGSPIFNKLWTLLGNPCVNIAALNCPKTNMPLGLQAIGAFGNDKMTLSCSAAIEATIRN